MAEINRPRPTVEELTGKIREEIARHRPGAAAAAFDHHPPPAEEGWTADDAHATALFPPINLQPDFAYDDREQYHVNELLKYHDAKFVQNAYRAILKRAPDNEGYESYLESLRSGASNKIDVLASLRYCEEGRAKNVRVEGLKFPAAIRRLGRLPIIGYPIRLGISILRLPLLIQHQQQFESHTLAQQEQLADYCNRLRAALLDFSRKHDELASRTEALAAHLSEETQRLGARIDEESARLQQLFEEQLRRTRSELVLQEHRLQRLFEEGRTFAPRQIESERAPLEQATGASSPDRHFLDAFYAALEDRFRGSRAEIKERFRVYLAHVRAAETVTKDAPLVDLGCGRGEWLELLLEEGILARGVDLNAALLDECRERNLDVSDSDALAYLKKLPDQSLGAITGFHIIEHLPVETLVEIVDEALRTLRPGGLVIFETPNPENVLVGSCYFYFDPTHRNPLPSLLMKFLLEARGFNQVEVLNLHPWESARVSGDDALTARFNELFYGPMDYAIMGRRFD